MIPTNIRAINQRWFFTFENVGYDLLDSGWKARYGGNISVTSETSYAGSKCLKMVGRTESWHSPALQLDSVFDQGGPGIYAITVYVKVSSLPTDSLRFGRSIIRGFEETSFIELRGTNYFCPIVGATIPVNEWICLQGSVRVTSEDIHRGEFFWMLDCIDACDGQIIYIDNFSIFKASDSTEYMNTSNGPVYDLTAYVVNDKAYEDYYTYENMPYFSDEEDAVSWYYNRMDNVNYQGQYELIFTFTKTQVDQLIYNLADMHLEQWWENCSSSEIEALSDICSAVLGQLPGLELGLDIIDVANEIQNEGDAYLSSLEDFTLALTYYSMPASSTQENITFSICLLRKSVQGGFEYKFYRTDETTLVREQVGILNENIFCILVNVCSKVIAGNYNFPVSNLSYTQRPSVNKVYPNYSYILAYTLQGIEE